MWRSVYQEQIRGNSPYLPNSSHPEYVHFHQYESFSPQRTAVSTILSNDMYYAIQKIATSRFNRANIIINVQVWNASCCLPLSSLSLKICGGYLPQTALLCQLYHFIISTFKQNCSNGKMTSPEKPTDLSLICVRQCCWTEIQLNCCTIFGSSGLERSQQTPFQEHTQFS